MCRIALLVLGSSALACGEAPTGAAGLRSQDRNAVVHRGTVFVSLDALLAVLGGTSELARAGQSVSVSAQGKTWEFLNGGDQLQDPSGQVRRLRRPILVLNGNYFLPAAECASSFGYVVQGDPPSSLSKGGKKLDLRPASADSEYQAHPVEAISVVHEPVKTLKEVRALASLHAGETPVRIPAGATLLARRKLTVKGTAYVLATDCGPGLRSYLVDEGEWKGKVQAADLRDTAWARYRPWFAKEAEGKFGLRFGDRENVRKGVALTVDLCWSLRRYEEDFFQSLRKMADPRKGVSAMIFVSGRWLEQHPTEMHSLIELSRRPGLDLAWGNHSWVHPKSGDFLNDLSRAEVREDTLRMERLFLEWGIVPTVYYRFPGLIHDRDRLQEILDLDLFPIDCETWIALLGSKHAYANPVQDGSIILVHGNGNEAKGIVAFNKWLKEHADWKLLPLAEFLGNPK